MQARFLDGCTAAEYHADPCDTPSLSSSVASALIKESPYHAWMRHPKLGKIPFEPSATMDRGTLLHALVLGTPLKQRIIQADNYRTKAAQEARDAARADGLMPVLEKDSDDNLAVALSIRAALKAQGIDLSGQSERVAVWEEETGWGKVLCRCMMDHVYFDKAIVFDLKTSHSANPTKFARSVIDHGYDIQYAAYTSAIRALNPEWTGREDFVWLVVEEMPPESPRRVLLTVARPDGMMQELGRAKWNRACRTWAECLRDNNWPAYADKPVRIEAPPWSLKEELGVTS